MSKFIINEYPLVVLPSLAASIGLNEAIILQQIHYWLDPKINSNVKESKFWVYNTYDQWLEQFPFWSITTIKRAIISLEKKGIVISSSFNKDKFNKTKWYSINYEVLGEFVDRADGSDQNDTSVKSKRPNSCVKLTQSYKTAETTTEITTDNTLSLKSECISVKPKLNSSNSNAKDEREKEMINIWNEVIEGGKGIKTHLTEKRTFILGLRLKEYFEEDILLWKEFCKKVTTSKFLMGEVTNFKVQLDWVLNEDKLIKILENSYGIGDREIFISNDSIAEYEEEIKDPFWLEARKKLEVALGHGTFSSWIKQLRFQAISEETIFFIAHTEFIKDWVVRNYSEDIKNILKSSGIEVKEVSIQVA